MRQHGATRHVVALAALNLTLAGLTGGRDHVVATPLNNRDDPTFVDTVGWISSLIAVRTRWVVGEAADTGELLRVSQAANLAAIENAMPWGEIIKTVKPDNYLGNPRQPQVYFDFIGEDRREDSLRLRDIACTEVSVGEYGGYAAFNLVLTEDPQGWTIHVTASRGVFDENSANRLLHGYERSLEWIVERGDQPLAEAEADVALRLGDHLRSRS